MATWKEITEDRYDEMLSILPPAVWVSHGFLVGEPWDHNEQGIPRFSAFVRLDGKYFECLSPMTPREFRNLSRNDITIAA